MPHYSHLVQGKRGNLGQGTKVQQTEANQAR